MNVRLGLGLVLLAAVGCAGSAPEDTASSHDALRPLNTEEALAELKQVGNAIRANYGPLEYKKERFGFDLDKALAVAKSEIEAAQNEADRVRPFYKLLSQLQDGHVSFNFPVRATETVQSSIPFMLTPVEDAFLVANNWDVNSPLKNGDKVLSIDGKTPDEMLKLLAPYGTVGTAPSTRHRLATQMTFRTFYTPAELQPKGENAHVVFEKPDGTQQEVDMRWFHNKGGFAGLYAQSGLTASAENPEIFSEELGFTLTALHGPVKHDPNATTLTVGDSLPFFMTPQVVQKFGMIEVFPKAETLAQVGVNRAPEDPNTPENARFIPIRAFKYRFGGKTVLLVRIPGYILPQNNYDEVIAWLAALLKDNAPVRSQIPGIPTPELPLSLNPAEVADVLVVDETHNPGGSVPYVQGLATLFLKEAKANFVQATRADRMNLNQLTAQSQLGDPTARPIFFERLSKTEAAYDANTLLAPFYPLTGQFQGPTFPQTGVQWAGEDMLQPHPFMHWTKPMIVLHDELSGSGGDAFPMMLKNSGVPTFGATTAGLGGSVIPILTLPFSGAQLRLTRGLFGVKNDTGGMTLIENVGVTPTHPYAHTVKDMRAGYIDYTTAFSKVVASLSL